MNIFRPLARKDALVINEMQNEVLVYDINTNKAFCLNETSSVIWRLCNGRNDVSNIRRIAGQRLGAEVSEDVVWLALDELKKNDLISGEYTSIFQGMGRREVIRKIGLATAIALPLIFSVIAPSAASAASCIAGGTACTSPGTCCTGYLCAFTPTGQSCTCHCTAPGDCITQTGCPNPNNCNLSMVCAP